MGKKKLLINDIRNSFENDGYVLLTVEYTNCSQKLEYVCPNNHKHSISWDNWKQGHRCPYCAGQGRPTIDFVRYVFEKEGYKLLTTKYINSDNQLSYACPHGHRHTMRWNNWRIGRRCPSCKAIKHSKRTSGSGHYNWKGGITPFNKELRNFIKFIGWGGRVFKRDGYTCVVCKNRGGKLVAHHIIPISYIKERFNISSIAQAEMCDILRDINNGVTLCKTCHDAYHKEFKGGLKNYERKSWRNSEMVCNKPSVVATLHRNSSNCWEPLTGSAEGNQQRSLEKGTFNDQSQDVDSSESKRGGSQKGS